jgi:hypothetical protein
MGKKLFIKDLISPNTGSAMSMANKAIISDFQRRYAEKLMKEIKVYCIKDGNNYIIHGIVPSEHNDEYIDPIFYDVVFEFYPQDASIKTDLTIKNYNVKVFCNSPNWMFTFTYLFAKHDCIPNVIPKRYYGEAALSEPSKEKNPLKLFGIDRVVFMILYHLELTTGFRKNRLNLIEMYKMKPRDIVNKIMGQEEKLDQINFEKKKAKIKKQGDKEKKSKSDEKAEKKHGRLKTKILGQENLMSNLSKRQFTDPLNKAMESDLKHTGTSTKLKVRAQQKRNDSLRSSLTKKK